VTPRHRRHHSSEGEINRAKFWPSRQHNYHVVDHAKSVQVTADDGTIYTAKVIGTDQKTDLALIKVDGKNDFPFVNSLTRPLASAIGLSRLVTRSAWEVP
jgi:Trypsin-like peptidase domain